MKISVHVDLDDDEAQPQTLEAWLARQQRDLLLMRSMAHAQLDAWFDQHAQRLVLDAACIEREMAGAAQH